MLGLARYQLKGKWWSWFLHPQTVLGRGGVDTLTLDINARLLGLPTGRHDLARPAQSHSWVHHRPLYSTYRAGLGRQRKEVLGVVVISARVCTHGNFPPSRSRIDWANYGFPPMVFFY